MRHLDKVEREVGKSLDDLFAVILRNGNVAAASRDDDQRMARQKQQRKAYLFNVLRTATLTGGLRLIMADEAARAAAAAQRQHDGLESDAAGPEPAPAPSGDILPTMIRAALQMQLVQGKRVAEARAAVAPRNRKNASTSPGQLLSEVLSQVSAAELHARAVKERLPCDLTWLACLRGSRLEPSTELTNLASLATPPSTRTTSSASRAPERRC